MKPEMYRWHNRILWCVAFPPILAGTIVNEVFLKNFKWKTRRGHPGKNSGMDLKECEDREQAIMEDASDFAAREDQGRLAIERLEDQISERRLEAMSKLQDEISLIKTKKEEELKERFRNFERDTELEIATKKKMEMARMEEELIKLKKRNEEEIRAEKAKALAGVSEWTEREEKRLRDRLEREYEAQLNSLRGALEKKVQDEFVHIHELFASLADQKKTVAEKDIKEFLDKKLSDIVSTIKT